MISRVDYVAVNAKAIASLEKAKADMPHLSADLRALIELRVSQINGCAYCIEVHAAEARDAGVEAARLERLASWRAADLFTNGERAALAWAEAVTLIAETGAPQTLLDDLRGHFTDEEIVDLTLAIAQMNAWNRLAISFGHEPERLPEA